MVENEDVLVSEVEVPVLVVGGFDVLAGECAGYDVVILVLEANDGEDVALLTFSLPSEDAKRIGAALTAQAASVRPIQVQTHNAGLMAEKETPRS